MNDKVIKEKWHQWVVDNKQYWRSGFTLNRLQKVKPYLLENIYVDAEFTRHGAFDALPTQMRMNNTEGYNHFVTNLTGIMKNLMQQHKILK